MNEVIADPKMRRRKKQDELKKNKHNQQQQNKIVLPSKAWTIKLGSECSVYAINREKRR